MRQGERQLLPGRQVIGCGRISSAVDRYPEVVQEVDVIVLFIACEENVLEIRIVFFHPSSFFFFPPAKKKKKKQSAVLPAWDKGRRMHVRVKYINKYSCQKFDRFFLFSFKNEYSCFSFLF